MDKKAFQKPFVGPLERIAGSQRFSSGKFIIDDVLLPVLRWMRKP
ncbi:MAG: hypothetical protein V8R52_07565 [Coprobacter fastidiosus]